MLLAICTGLLAGVVHVFSGPDHLAAIAPLAVGRRGAWRTGARWGLGHSAGVAMVGALALAFRDALPLDRVSSWCERLVGIVLIGVGLWSLRRASSRHVHSHEHVHGGDVHAHYHVHDCATRHAHGEPAPHAHTHAAFAVGTLHGLAGGAHVVAVLPALAFPDWTEGASYIAAYMGGTIVAMAAFASAAGSVSLRSPGGSVTAYRDWMGACGTVALVVGGWWLVVVAN